MRKLVVDFDLIVLWPSIAFALIVFATSLRTYLSPSAGYWEAIRNGEDIAEWRRNQKSQVKDLLWISAVALLILVAIMLMSDTLKLGVAYLTWDVLRVSQRRRTDSSGYSGLGLCREAATVEAFSVPVSDVDGSRQCRAFLPSKT